MHLRYFEAIAEATDKVELFAALEEITNELDFGQFTLLWWSDTPGQGQINYVHNTPDAYLAEASDPDRSMADPVYRHIISSPRPVIYDQEVYVAAGVPELWDTQAPFGYKAGIALAMNVNGARMSFGFDRDAKPPKDADRRAYLVAQVSMIVSYAQDTHKLLLDAQDKGSGLSPQRLQVLRLIAEGKSDGVIAQILGTSKHNVNFHLRKIYEALGVSTRVQAAVKAAKYLYGTP